MSVLAPTAGGSRPFNFRLGFGLPALLMAALLIGEPSQLDFALSRLFYEPGAGFVGRHSWLLEDFLHDRVKQLVILIGVLAIAGFLLSLLHNPTWILGFSGMVASFAFQAVALSLGHAR